MRDKKVLKPFPGIFRIISRVQTIPTFDTEKVGIDTFHINTR